MKYVFLSLSNSENVLRIVLAYQDMVVQQGGFPRKGTWGLLCIILSSTEASYPLSLSLKPNTHTGCTRLLPGLLSFAPSHNGFAWSSFREETCWDSFHGGFITKITFPCSSQCWMDIETENVKKSNFNSGLAFKSIYFKPNTRWIWCSFSQVIVEKSKFGQIALEIVFI